jgi:nitroreductase
MDYKNLIPKIKSVRDYKDTKVSEDILFEIKDSYKKGKKLIDNIDIEVFIKDKEEIYYQLEGIAGYKEYMLEAPHYILILSEEKDCYIENTGYIGQGMILKAFELGVNSCWITFDNGDEIMKKLVMDSEKKLTALIALGYDDNKTKVENETNLDYNPSKANIVKAEDNVATRIDVSRLVYIKEWGKCADTDDLSSRGLLDAFNYARLAPSTLNRQPWRFIIDDGIVVLAIREDKDINAYEEKIEIGAIMLYFESVIDSTLFDTSWTMGNLDKDYNIPEDYKVVGYCNI